MTGTLEEVERTLRGFLLLLVRPLLLVAMHLFLVASCYVERTIRGCSWNLLKRHWQQTALMTDSPVLREAQFSFESSGTCDKKHTERETL